jgi:hypothetical protein
MKILSEMKPTVAKFSSTLIKIGWEWIWWHPSKPTFDAFDEEKPDFVFTEGKPPGLVECVEEYNTQWIHFDGSEATHKQSDEKRMITPMIDHFVYHNVEPTVEFACDLAYVGTKCPEMLKLCIPIGEFHVKIAGEKRWPVPQYIGKLTSREQLQLYSSAQIVYAKNIDDALIALACGKWFVGPEYYETLDTFTEKKKDGDYSVTPIRELLKQFLDEGEKTDFLAKQLGGMVFPKWTAATFIADFLEKINYEVQAKKIRELINDKQG